MKLTKKDVEKLAEGIHPKYINGEWDCAMIIDELAKAWLDTYDKINKKSNKQATPKPQRKERGKNVEYK